MMKRNTSRLTAQLVSELVQASQGNPDLHDCIQLLVSSGLRRGELERLCWGDIDLVAGTLRVNGKSNGGRTVLLDEQTKQVLGTRLRKQLVFGPRSRSTLRRVGYQLRGVGATLGLVALGFHELRIYFVTRMLGVPLTTEPQSRFRVDN